MNKIEEEKLEAEAEHLMNEGALRINSFLPLPVDKLFVIVKYKSAPTFKKHAMSPQKQKELN